MRKDSPRCELVFDDTKYCVCVVIDDFSSSHGMSIPCDRMQMASRRRALVACVWRYFHATWFETCIPDDNRQTIRQLRDILSSEPSDSSSSTTKTDSQAEDIWKRHHHERPACAFACCHSLQSDGRRHRRRMVSHMQPGTRVQCRIRWGEEETTFCRVADDKMGELEGRREKSRNDRNAAHGT